MCFNKYASDIVEELTVIPPVGYRGNSNCRLDYITWKT